MLFFPSPFFRFFNLRPFAFCFPPFPNSATRAVAKSSPRPPTGAPDPLFFRQYKNNNTTPGRERPQKRSEAREKERERAAAPPHRKCSSSFCSTFFFEEKKKTKSKLAGVFHPPSPTFCASTFPSLAPSFPSLPHFTSFSRACAAGASIYVESE